MKTYISPIARLIYLQGELLMQQGSTKSIDIDPDDDSSFSEKSNKRFNIW